MSKARAIGTAVCRVARPHICSSVDASVLFDPQMSMAAVVVGGRTAGELSQVSLATSRRSEPRTQPARAPDVNRTVTAEIA